jgi:hypothetical protein
MTTNTTGDSLSNISKLITESCDLLGLDDKDSSKLHSYGLLNVEQQREVFKHHISNLRMLVLQYKEWVTKSERDLKNYMTLLKNQLKLKTHVEQLKNSLSRCQSVGRQYLEYGVEVSLKQAKRHKHMHSGVPGEHRQLIAHINGGRLLAAHLKEMVEEFSKEFDLYSELDELNTLVQEGFSLVPALPSTQEQRVTVNISSHTFLLDVIINMDGTVHDVKLMLISLISGAQVQDPGIDQELLQTLQRGRFGKFKRRILHLAKLDRLYRKFPDVDLQLALKNLERDLLYASNANPNSGYGKVETGCKGLRLLYFDSPALAPVPRRINDCYAMELSLEFWNDKIILPSSGLQGVDQANAVPSVMDTTADTSFPAAEVSVPSSNNEGVPVRFVVWLKPKVILPLFTLKKLLAYTNGFNNSTSTAGNENFTPLSWLLAGKEYSAKILPRSLDSSLNVMGTNFQFVYSGAGTGAGGEIPSVVVSRINFTHPQQLSHILQVLRQQALFNELFKSCFPKDAGGSFVGTNSSNNSNRHIAELVIDPPNSIFVTALHPRTQNLLCIEINCGLGGMLSTSIHPYKSLHEPNVVDSLTGNSAYITEILKASLSIPVAMKYAFEVS